MIVKERELVWFETGNPRGVWIGDLKLGSKLIDGELPYGEYFKVKHQLTCTECHVGVRAEDEHLCSAQD